MAGWVAGAGIAGSAIGSIFSASGAQQQASATAQSDQYQAYVAELNASLARRNATFAGEAGEQNASTAGLQGRATYGQIVAAQGANNLDVNSGSAKDVQAGSRFVTQTNEAGIRSNANQQVYAYRQQANTDDIQANMDISAAQNAQKAGQTSLLSSILGGATSVATKWSQASSSGVFDGSSIGSPFSGGSWSIG